MPIMCACNAMPWLVYIAHLADFGVDSAKTRRSLSAGARRVKFLLRV